MQFLILVCAGSDFAPDIEAMKRDWVDEVEGKGMRKTGARAYAPEDAVTVKVVGEEVTATPGPRVDADEQIAGFDLMEAASMEEMVDVASRHPMAAAGRIEIRPLYDE